MKGCSPWTAEPGRTPGLRALLAPGRLRTGGRWKAFELTHDFPRIGQRTLLLHARQGAPRRSAWTIFVHFWEYSRTSPCAARSNLRKSACKEENRRSFLRQKGTLLAEMEHRIVNSLQIIASILMLKARAVLSEETRGHLQDPPIRRVISLAAVQQHYEQPWRQRTWSRWSLF